jgi:hypothetical protein
MRTRHTASIFALSLALAAGVHLGAGLQHGAGGDHAVFFLAVGVAQTGLAVAGRRGQRRAVRAGVALSAAVVGVWLVTRLPVAGAGRQALGVVDAAATTLELITVASGLVLLRGAVPIRRLALGPVALAVAVLAMAGGTSVAAPSHAGHGHDDDAGVHQKAGYDHEPDGGPSRGGAEEPGTPIFGDLFDGHPGHG